LDTLWLVIGLATSRVFCRLPPGSVQPAAAAALAGAGALPVPAGVVVPVTACLPKQGGAAELLLLVPLPLQAAARLASTARDIPAAAYPALLMAASWSASPPGPAGQALAFKNRYQNDKHVVS
jgi:hypothetical protein